MLLRWGHWRWRRLAAAGLILVVLAAMLLTLKLHFELPTHLSSPAPQAAALGQPSDAESMVNDRDRAEAAQLRANLNRAEEREAELRSEVERLAQRIRSLEVRPAPPALVAAPRSDAAVPLAVAQIESHPPPAPPSPVLHPAALAEPSPEDLARPAETPSHPRLALFVPYRRAEAELQEFVPFMHRFLTTQSIDFTLVVVNQTDGYRFNRGLLLNAGFLEAEKDCNYIALHDVDLLPLNPRLSYGFPKYPMHISAPWLHPNYHYKTFIGGILLLANEHFRLINGLSINFWGWGREDDELYKRIVSSGLKVERPPVDIGTNSSNTFTHLHDDDARPRDMMKIGNQYLESKKRDTSTGLSTTREHYKVVSSRTDMIQGYSYRVIDVELRCDTDVTPWCITPAQCKDGYYRKPIKGDPSRWVCKRCGTRCWRGFVLVGHCTQYETPACFKVGRDISVEEARKWPAGKMDPH